MTFLQILLANNNVVIIEYYIQNVYIYNPCKVKHTK